MNILLNSPDHGLPGGVSKYCSIIMGKFKNNVQYFIVGKRGINDGFISKCFTSIKNYGKFFRSLNNIDLVHINPSLRLTALIRDSIYLLMAKMYRKKVVVFFHGWDENFERMIRRFFLWPFRFVYFRADAIIVLGSVIKKKIADMGYREEIYVETTTVDNEMFSQGAVALASRRKESGREGTHILFLSRIEKEKGIYEAIDSYSLLKNHYPQAALTVVGDGSELGRVCDYVATNGIPDVHFRGYLSGMEIREAFIAADVYLFPTWGEGLPISILEAMVYGLPVLTRPVGGIPDFFEDGKMGFLLESKEPAIFAEKMEQLARDRELALSMGEYNHRYAASHFRPDKVVDRLEAIYEKVMADAAV